MDRSWKLNTRDARRRFDRAAASFDSADFVHSVSRDGLFARLEPLVVEAKHVLDLGSATGSAGAPLRKRFTHAHIVSLDFSHAMLQQARGKRRWFRRSSCVQADANRLPFAGQSFDVVFANQLLPWIDDPAQVLSEVSRVLREDGLFAFATLGPDSLSEITTAWDDGQMHIIPFPDMHDVGDALVRAGLRDPVIDVDRLTVRYRDANKLFADLTRMGARNSLLGRSPTLAGRGRFQEMVDALASGGEISIDLELVYGHCWGSGASREASAHRIDASAIGRRRR